MEIKEKILNRNKVEDVREVMLNSILKCSQAISVSQNNDLLSKSKALKELSEAFSYLKNFN